MKRLVVAKVILVGPDDKILLLRRSESDVRRPHEFDIPGGHTDGAEYGNEAAARETLEEAGITVDPRELKLVYSEAMAVSDDLSVVWLFYVGHTDTSEVVLSTEHEEYRWVSMAEAIELIDYDRQKRALSYVLGDGLVNS